MITVKHVESKDGRVIHESVVQAKSVAFYPKSPTNDHASLDALGVFGDGLNGSEHATYANGHIYVMNENGKTVASYDLD